MSTFALALVLSAAVLHATWNAIVKGGGDRAVILASISAVHVVIGVVLALIFPLPAAESWPYLIASTLIHFFYYAALVLSYRLGDLSQVYPVARGMAPVLVALGAEYFADEMLSPEKWFGIITVSVGIMLLLAARRNNRLKPAALAAAVFTGLMIASYSVVDGIGARHSDSAFSYIGWLFLLEFPVVLFVAARRPGALTPASVQAIKVGAVGGVFAGLAYSLVIYAKTIAPLGAVSAVRESSVIIAALIGVIWFHERPWGMRVISAILVCIGVVALATSV